MCCLTSRRDGEELLHRTITYKIGPYVLSMALDTPSLLTSLIHPLTGICQEMDSYSDKQRSLWKSHRHTEGLPEKKLYSLWGMGEKFPWTLPLNFINAYIHHESDPRENTFSLTNLWKGGKLPRTPPFNTSTIPFTNKTDQQGNILSPTNLSKSLVLIRHVEKLYHTQSTFLLFKYHIDVIGTHCSFGQWLHVV